MVENPEHRFLYFLFKKTGKLPDDTYYDEIDPLLRLWLYESWIHEQQLELKRDRALGILIGSFTDPDAAQKMMKRENPDFVASEEEHDEAFKQIHESALKDRQQKGRRNSRRRHREVVKQQ